MNKFLAMWDNLGLETVIDLNAYYLEHDAWEKKKSWAVLKGEELNEHEPRIPLQEMILRARFNNQRHYEIYIFTTDENEQFVRDMFAFQPQAMVDTIRKCGHKVFGERAERPLIV